MRTRRIIYYAFLAVAFSAAAGPVYLPAVGPPALRFEAPRVEPLHAPPRLPPLPPLEPKAAIEQPAPVDVVEPVTGTPPAVFPATNHPASTPANVAGGTQEPPAAPAGFLPAPEPRSGPIENLTPQMFMKFFTGRPGTNTAASGTTIFAPLPFMPPVPPAPPSSSATFQTTPPARP